MQTLRQPAGLRAPRLAVRPQRASKLVCQASAKGALEQAAVIALSATVLAAPLVDVQEAFAAQSGGRASASGFSKRRAAAPAKAQSTTVVNNTTIVAAPPVFSPFGFGGFGFGMPMFMPMFSLSSMLGFMALMLGISLVFSVVQGVSNAASGASKDNKKDWDSL